MPRQLFSIFSASSIALRHLRLTKYFISTKYTKTFTVQLIITVTLLILYHSLRCSKPSQRAIYRSFRYAILPKLWFTICTYKSTSSSFNFLVKVLRPHPSFLAASCLWPCVYFSARCNKIFSKVGIASPKILS